MIPPKRILRAQAASLDRLISAITAEHARAASASRDGTPEKHRVGMVQRLLDGERFDASELALDLDGSLHTAVIAEGSGAGSAIRELAKALGRRLLMVCPDQKRTWAWLSGREKLKRDDLNRTLCSLAAKGFKASLGEDCSDLEGWRISHRQARAVLPIALEGLEPWVRYGDAALLACATQDDLFIAYLRSTFLAPVSGLDGGPVLIATLRAFFDAERNISSAAAALAVNRKTVASRLRAVEECIGRPLSTCLAEIEIALRIERLERFKSLPRLI